MVLLLAGNKTKPNTELFGELNMSDDQITTFRKKKSPRDTVFPEKTQNTSPAAAVVRYGVGFDVHKETIVVCVKAQLFDATIIEIQTHTFKAHPAGIDEICHYLLKYQPVSFFLMECTGVYHLPLYYALKAAFPKYQNQVIAMNPLMINHRLAEFGNKHDKADAQGIATLAFYDGLIKPSYIGERSFMELRDLTRAYAGNRQHTSRIKNQLTRILHANNLKFPFDYSATWVQQFLAFYVNNSLPLLEALDYFILDLKAHQESTGVIEKKRDDLIPFGEIKLDENARYHLSLLLERLQYDEILGASLLVQVETKILENPDFASAYRQLLAVPGFGSISALTILTELGDYHRFTNWEQMAKFAGVVPQIGKSADVVHKGHINRYSNGILRQSLCQVATVLINRADKSFDLGAFAFQQYHIKQKPFKLALIKVSQKLIRVIYAILVLGIEYSAVHEKEAKRNQIINRRYQQKKSYLEPIRVRALMSDINRFLVTHYDALNSKGRYHLVHGFHSLLKKASNNSDEVKKSVVKKRNVISKGDC